jgi:hypothetical protein
MSAVIIRVVNNFIVFNILNFECVSLVFLTVQNHVVKQIIIFYRAFTSFGWSFKYVDTVDTI